LFWIILVILLGLLGSSLNFLKMHPHLKSAENTALDILMENIKLIKYSFKH